MSTERAETTRTDRGGIGFEFTLVLIALGLTVRFPSLGDNGLVLSGRRVPAMPILFSALALPVLARFSGGRLDQDRLRMIGGLLAAGVAGVWIVAAGMGRGTSEGTSIRLTGFLVLGLAEALIGWWGARRAAD